MKLHHRKSSQDAALPGRISTSVALALGLGVSGYASSVLADYGYAPLPLFWASGAQPNVMMVLDTSGSMGNCPAGSSSGCTTKITSMKSVATQVVNDNAANMRIGLFRFNDTYGRYQLPCGSSATDLSSTISGFGADDWTPLATAFYESVRYYRGMNRSNTSSSSVATYTSPIQYRCQKNFAIVLTDGKPTRGMENPGSGVSDGTLKGAGTTGDTQTGGVTNPWGSYNFDTAGTSWDGFPDPKMSGDSDGYYPLTDDVAQFAYDIDMKGASSTTTCPTGSPTGAGTAGLDCAGKSWDDPAFPTQNVVTYTIGFDVQNELLRDTPLVNRLPIDATDVDVAANTIRVRGHGLATGDYIQYLNQQGELTITGTGNTGTEQITVNNGTIVPATGSPVVYSSEGGTALTHIRTETTSVSASVAVANAGINLASNVFTGSTSHMTAGSTVLTNTTTGTNSFRYTGAATTEGFRRADVSTSTEYIVFGNTRNLLVGTPLYYYRGGTTRMTINGTNVGDGTALYVASCGAVTTLYASCPAGNNSIRVSQTLGGAVANLTGTGNDSQYFAYNRAMPAADDGPQSYCVRTILSANTFTLATACGGGEVDVISAGGAQQNFTFNYNVVNTFHETAGTYYVIRLSDTTFRLALSSSNALAGTYVDLSNGGNASQSFSFTGNLPTVGGLYPYETDREPDSTPAPATESYARGKYCVIRVDADTFRLGVAAAGSNTICTASPTAIDLTSAGFGIFSTGPGKAYFSTDGAALSRDLNAAFLSITDLSMSASAVATNSSEFSTGSFIYQAKFNTSDWSGDVVAIPIVDGEADEDSVTWRAQQTVTPGRAVYTYRPGTGGITLAWNNLSSTQQSYLTGGTSNATLGGQVVNWLRGTDQTAVAAFRIRNRGLIGDIINSNPAFVSSNSDEGLATITTGGSTYGAFVARKATLRPNGLLFVGANDGMLHGFDTSNGNERFAFIPNGVYMNWTETDNNGVYNSGETIDYKLYKLTQKGYGVESTNQHRFFVDGSPSVSDAYINVAGCSGAPDATSSGCWRTALVGGLNSGGRSIFALDVTDNTFATSDVLWEYTHAELGYTYSRPLIGKLANGTWAAIFGNGYDSSGDRAQLFVVNLATGALIRKIDTGVGTNNGLSSVALRLGGDDDKTVIAVYGGDLRGNFWKFDLSSTSSASWTANVFFEAEDKLGNPQPITGAPTVSDYSDHVIVHFGTGKYFETGDDTFINTTLPRHNSVYALLDIGDNDQVSRSDLVQQWINGSFTGSTTDGVDQTFYTSTQNEVDYESEDDPDRGWYMNLITGGNSAGEGSTYVGERSVSAAITYGPRLLFTTLLPGNTDQCQGGGSSHFFEVNRTSGAMIGFNILDTNGDGVIDENDEMVSGFSYDDGILSQPTALTNPEDNTIVKAMGSTGASRSLVTVTNSAVSCEENGNCATVSAGRMSWRQLH